MDDALPVGVRERPGNVAEDARGFGGRHRSAPPHPLRQSLALDVRHREEHEFADLFDGVNRNDVGVGELGRGACLTQELLSQSGIRCLRGRQQLDRHGAVKAYFPRQVHDAHAPAPQLALQGIPASDGGLKVEEQPIHALF